VKKRKFLILLPALFPILLIGRENPFVPPVHGSAIVAKPSAESAAKELPKAKTKRAVFRNEKMVFEIGDDIKILLKERLKRAFTLSSPKKIVLDFKGKADFGSGRWKIEHPCIGEISVGAHSDFFRAALRMKKDCRYEIKSIKGGYKIEFE